MTEKNLQIRTSDDSSLRFKELANSRGLSHGELLNELLDNYMQSNAAPRSDDGKNELERFNKHYSLIGNMFRSALLSAEAQEDLAREKVLGELDSLRTKLTAFEAQIEALKRSDEDLRIAKEDLRVAAETINRLQEENQTLHQINSDLSRRASTSSQCRIEELERDLAVANGKLEVLNQFLPKLLDPETVPEN